MGLLMASSVLCLLLGKRKVKVNPLSDPDGSGGLTPGLKEAIVGVSPARPGEER